MDPTLKTLYDNIVKLRVWKFFWKLGFVTYTTDCRRTYKLASKIGNYDVGSGVILQQLDILGFDKLRFFSVTWRFMLILLSLTVEVSSSCVTFHQTMTRNGHRWSERTPYRLIRSWCSPGRSSFTKQFDPRPVLFARCRSGSWRNRWKTIKGMGRLGGFKCSWNLKWQDYNFIIPFGLSGMDFRESRSIYSLMTSSSSPALSPVLIRL